MRALAPSRVAVLVAGLLAAQGVLARLVLESGILPPPPDLSRFPRIVDRWESYGEMPGSEALAAQLSADRLSERIYFRTDNRRWLNLLVAWFQSQRGGAQQPHSPKVCLPGAGWMPVENAEIAIATTAGIIRVNRYKVANRGQVNEVLYWYQTPRRVVASELAAKFYVVLDGIRDRRTDTALVRVTTAGGALDDAVAFVRAAYPILRETLPK
jgi:EpsI family protein